MLTFVDGDFFDYDADIRINTVNCVGVMGAGVALAFKHRYPMMYDEYVDQCNKGLIKPGVPTVWSQEDLTLKKIEIINFPTKSHWKKKSEYTYISDGLEWLSNYLLDKKDKVVTLPALGCGHGGLEWEKVKEMIINYLDGSPSNILVFEPKSSKQAGSLSLEGRVKNKNASKIKVLKKLSNEYPMKLAGYTGKDLFVFNYKKLPQDFDITLVISSKPDEVEMNIINKIIYFCAKNNLSVLFGPTLIEKKIALNLSRKGNLIGVFLPTNIFNSADELSVKDSNIVLLSIGDPFVSFDKKEYLPSVISRIYLSKYTIFTTPRLEWLKKRENDFLSSDSKLLYIDYENLKDEDRKSVEILGGVPLSVDDMTIF